MESSRFDELLQVWQDGSASKGELQELESLLRVNVEYRRELVGSVLLEVNLYARQTAMEGRRDIANDPSSFLRKRSLDVAAAVIVSLVSLTAVGYLLFRGDTSGPRPSPGARGGQGTPAASPAALTLSDAIDRAQSQAPGTVLRAVLENEDGRVAFSVELAHHGKMREIVLDVKTGAVLEDQMEAEEGFPLAKGFKITLKDAIEKALQAVPGRAVEAEFELKGRKARAEVKILTDAGLREVMMDAETGEVLRTTVEKE